MKREWSKSCVLKLHPSLGAIFVGVELKDVDVVYYSPSHLQLCSWVHMPSIPKPEAVTPLYH